MIRVRRWWRALSSVVAAAALGGCELAEVGTAPAEDVLVVEGILRAGSARQGVILHHTLLGRTAPGETGARVTLAGADGVEVVLQETPLQECADRIGPGSTDSITVTATCYLASGRRGFLVVPGATYELRVTTRDGRQVRGRTTVPGAFSLRSPRVSLGRQCALPPNTNLPLVWSVSRGAWSYISEVEITGLRQALLGQGINAPERLELTGVAISEQDTTLIIPADFGVFSLGEVDQEVLKVLQRGFPAGTTARITIAAADRNYINAVRGGGFNPSGNVRLSSVVGDGVGVFGSIVPLELVVVAGTTAPIPRCLTG